MRFSAETSRAALHALDPEMRRAPRSRSLAHNLRHVSDYTPTGSAAPVTATTHQMASRFLQIVDYIGELPPAGPEQRLKSATLRGTAETILKKGGVRTVGVGSSPGMRVRAMAHADTSPGAVWEFVGCADEVAISDDAWEEALEAGLGLEELLLACQLAIIETLSPQEGASVESAAGILLSTVPFES